MDEFEKQDPNARASLYVDQVSTDKDGYRWNFRLNNGLTTNNDTKGLE